MARQSRYSDKPHARFYCEWTNLPAWRALGPDAKALLLDVLMRYRPGQNLFRISDRTAADWIGCSRPSAVKAFAQLEECGWITVEQVGRTKGPNARRACCYSLTCYPDDDGNPATMAFETWIALQGRLKPRPVTAKKRAIGGTDSSRFRTFPSYLSHGPDGPQDVVFTRYSGTEPQAPKRAETEV